MLITCLTCKINVNLVPLDERDINIVDYLFHPHSTPYLEQLKSNEATRICTSCQENIRDIDKFRNSALKNFLQLMQVLEIKPILRTCLAQSTSQQDTLAEIQSPSLDSTVLVKTERSELDAEELHIKPDLEDGIDEEQPQSDLSRMMLDNILQGMYVAKTTPTVINVTEEAVSNPASQSSQHDQVEDKSVATQPAIDIVKAERTTTSPGNKSISGKKKTSDLMYRKGFDVQRHRDEQNVKFKCSECSKTFRKKKVVQRLATMWELARRPPPSDHEFYPKVVQLVHKHYTDGWKNWVINDIPYEELFGKTIDTELEKKIRFLLPSVELMRAWRPVATHASEQAVRDIRRRLLNWSFGRSLIYAPKNITVMIHDSYLFVNEVLLKLKPLILSRKALSAALKESVEGSKEGEVSQTPSASGLKRAAEGAEHQSKRKRNEECDELSE